MAENPQSVGFNMVKDELAAKVWQFEQLVSEQSARMRRIELLLDEIAVDDKRGVYDG